MEGKPHVVIIGFGPVASRLVEELLPDVTAGALRLTIAGSESRAAYQRIRLGDVSVGRIAPEELSTDNEEDLRAQGVDVLLNTTATGLDPAARIVTLNGPGGERKLTYTKIVLATGAEPIMPAMSVESRHSGNVDAEVTHSRYPDGVTALRDMTDALHIRSRLKDGGPVVVLGGGVLGVEAALAVAEVGIPVTLLHRGEVPMGRQLGTDAGMLLCRELMLSGVDVRAGSDVTTVVVDDGELTAVRTSRDEILPASLLITCTGVKPRDELAAAAGLPVKRGIVTGWDARSTGTAEGHADVYAVGDCAAVDGRDPSGLIGAGWAQAEAAAAALRQQLNLGVAIELDASGAPVEFDAAYGDGTQNPVGLEVFLLKSKTLNVACAGETSHDPWGSDLWDPAAPTVSIWSDTKRGQYLRIVTGPNPSAVESCADAPTGERLLGFVSVGLPRAAAELAMHATRGTIPVADRTALLAAEHATREVELGPDDVLCRCAGITAGTVMEATSTCCRTVKEISAETRAGTGCGTCHKNIEKILAAAASMTAPV